MKISPIDIEQQRFQRRFRGYDSRDVDLLLQRVSDTIETLMEEKRVLGENLESCLAENRAFREREEGFRTVMLNSRKVVEELENTARIKSEQMIARAEMDAEKIIGSASDRAAAIYDDINELIRQRTRFREQLRSELNSHRELLELFGRDEADGGLKCVDL